LADEVPSRVKVLTVGKVAWLWKIAYYSSCNWVKLDHF